MNPHADSVQRVGSTIYVLNARGHNRWSAQVQPGRDDNDERISDSECESIAEALARFGTRPAAEPVSEIVKLQIEVDEAIQSGSAGEVDLRDQLAEAKALADSEGARAVNYLRRARKAEAALSRQAPAAPAEAERVYLVATGETVGGLETYTRHKGAPPPLSDYERLYAAPTPADPQALLGWTRYEKARKLSVAQWAELHQRNLKGELFDDMIDALPATTQPAQQEGWTYDKNGSGKWEPVQQDTKHLTKAQFYDVARAAMRVYRDRHPPRYLNDDQASADDSEFIGELADCHEVATPPAEKQAAPSGEDKPVERCQCGYPMPCAKTVPITFCRAPAPQDTKGADNHG